MRMHDSAEQQRGSWLFSNVCDYDESKISISPFEIPTLNPLQKA